MALYICKCGRQVNKSSTADNTGNRDTSDCTGCPYLLPWGPDKYVEGQGFRKEVQGYECRMSPTISYTTSYRGQANDKCTLHILSLDLDFLDTVQAWIYDHAADTLTAGFSRGSMRGTDFSDKGRYSLSISCVQNKKGMAAKAALIEQFFTGGRVRKDMTLAQEKAHILAAIKRGKENASKMNYIISQHDNGLLYAYHLGTFWFWLADKRWVPSDFAKQEYEKAQKKNPRITPEEFMDSDDFIQMDDYEVPSQKLSALKALTPADSRMHAPDAEDATDASTVSAEPSESVDEFSDLDRPCPGDVYRSAKGGQLYKIGELTNGKKTCYLTMRCNVQDGTWVPANSSVYPNLSDAQGEFEAWIRREQLEPVAQTMDAAVITDERAAKEPSKAEETSTTSAIGADAGTSLPGSSCKGAPNSSPAPASPADAGAAAQSLSAAGPASLAAKDVNVPAFDFSALGDLAGQAAEADEQFNLHYGRAQDEFLVACIYMARIHALTAKAGRYGGGTWTSWYQSKGISEGSARTMVQNGDGFKSATAADLKNLPALTKKDINLIARQGAAEQVLEAAGQGDSARIQEIMAQLKAEQTARKQAEQALAAEKQSGAGTSALLADEQQRRQQANEARIAAENRAASAESRARAAERERDEARKERDGAREALQASKMRGDRLKAENDDLKARPIEVPAVDEDEIDRRVEARLQQERDDSLAEQREIAARNAQDAILLLGRQINTSWQMVRPFLAEMEESRRVEAIDRINNEWAQTQKEILQCL